MEHGTRYVESRVERVGVATVMSQRTNFEPKGMQNKRIWTLGTFLADFLNQSRIPMPAPFFTAIESIVASAFQYSDIDIVLLVRASVRSRSQS